MSNKDKLDLAERVQKRIQEKHPHFWLIKRRDEIEKEFKVKNENFRYGAFNET
jgi:hypothetical protein